MQADTPWELIMISKPASTAKAIVAVTSSRNGKNHSHSHRYINTDRDGNSSGNGNTNGNANGNSNGIGIGSGIGSGDDSWTAKVILDASRNSVSNS